MSMTQEDLQEFTAFASHHIANGGERSLQQLAIDWQTAKEKAAVTESIEQGLNDIEAGKSRPLDEFIDEFRTKNKIADNA